MIYIRSAETNLYSHFNSRLCNLSLNLNNSTSIMSDDAAPAAAPAAQKAQKKTAKPKKKSSPSTHPPCSEMIAAAITNLKERNGSSLQAIKKYIGANYKCDVAKLAPHIRKSLTAGVANGKLVQVKGKGASGSFKVSSAAAKPAKKAAKKKVAKKPAAKKAAKPKKAKAKKPAAKPKKAAKAKKPKKTAEKKPKKTKAKKTKKPAAKKAGAKKAKK